MKKSLILLLLLLPLIGYGANLNDIKFNEFSTKPTSGDSWVELINRSSANIDLADWQLSHLTTDEFGSTTVATTTLSSLLIPAGGLVAFSYELSTSSDSLILTDESGLIIDDVTYPDELNIPLTGQSAYSFGTEGGSPWRITDNPTPRWFNETIIPPPTKQSFLDAIASSSVTTNLTVDDDWTSFTSLYFSSADHGRLDWSGPLNLTGSAERATLQGPKTFINFDTGAISASGILATASSTFTSLAPITPPVTPPSGGGGGGGGGGSGSAPIIIATTTEPLIGRILGESTYRFSRYLRLGMRGADVGELQKRLKQEGLLLIKKTTTYFGPLTKKAVIAYQKKYKIRPVTGVVAKATVAKLNSLIVSTTTPK